MKIFYLVAIFFFLIITNSEYSFEDDITDVAAGDTYSYKSISENAPGFPTSDMTYQHAQRFIIPYLLGNISHIFEIKIYNVYRYANLVLIGGILILVFAIFQTLRFSNEAYYVGLSLIVFNPYIFRLHLAFPGLVTDIGFMFGLSLICFSLLRTKIKGLLLGSFVMIISRQTGLLALPGILGWLYFSDLWKCVILKKKALIVIGLLCINIFVYLLQIHVAEGFSKESHNIEYVTGILDWFLNHFNIQELFVFLIQGSIPYLMIVALVVGFGKMIAWKSINYKQIWLWLIFPLFICAQPYLGGPGMTGGNVTRLEAISFIPLIVGIICELDKQKVFCAVSKRVVFVVVCLIILASFHHLFAGYGFFKGFTWLFLAVQVSTTIVIASFLYFKAAVSNIRIVD